MRPSFTDTGPDHRSPRSENTTPEDDQEAGATSALVTPGRPSAPVITGGRPSRGTHHQHGAVVGATRDDLSVVAPAQPDE